MSDEPALSDDYQYHSGGLDLAGEPDSGQVVDPLHRRAQAPRRGAGSERAERRLSRRDDHRRARSLGHRQERADQAHHRADVPRLRRRHRAGAVGAQPDDAQAAGAAPQRSACCSRTARCSGRCRCSTTSPSRCASTPTTPRRRSPSWSHERLADVGLADAIDDLPSQLSGGMRKRAGLRAGARDGAGHRDLRRARLGAGPGAHGAAVRADPGDALDPRRHLHRRHPRHRLGAAGSASTSRCCGAGGSWRRAMPRGCSPRRTRSCASSSADPPRAR